MSLHHYHGWERVFAEVAQIGGVDPHSVVEWGREAKARGEWTYIDEAKPLLIAEVERRRA